MKGTKPLLSMNFGVGTARPHKSCFTTQRGDEPSPPRFMIPMRVQNWRWRLSMNRPVRGMIVRGIELIPLTIIPLTNLWESSRFIVSMRFKMNWGLSMNLKVGRVTPCTPSPSVPGPGAHGVTRPTGVSSFQGFNARILGGILSPTRSSREWRSGSAWPRLWRTWVGPESCDSRLP